MRMHRRPRDADARAPPVAALEPGAAAWGAPATPPPMLAATAVLRCRSQCQCQSQARHTAAATPRHGPTPVPLTAGVRT